MNSSVSGPSRIRQLNRSAVLAHIRLRGRDSRLKIGKELGLSPAAITSVVNELIEENFLINSSLNIVSNRLKSQGRPKSMLELNPNKGVAFGIILRPSANRCIIESAWSDYTGKVHIQSQTVETEKDNYQSIIDGINLSINSLYNCIPSKSKVYGLSVGVPGVVENQSIPIAPKLTCIEDTDFIKKLSNLYDFPVSFENDVNLGALFELQIQPRLRNISFAFLHVYSGIGSSIVLGGKLLKGSRGWAGEIGQLKIPSTKNKDTSFEQLLSVDEILGDLLEDLNHSRNDFDALVPYIENKSKNVIDTIDNYCDILFNVISIIHSVVDLDEVMIDFQSASLFDILLPKIEERIKTLPHSITVSTPSTEKQTYAKGAAHDALEKALNKIEKREIKQLKVANT